LLTRMRARTHTHTLARSKGAEVTKDFVRDVEPTRARAFVCSRDVAYVPACARNKERDSREHACVCVCACARVRSFHVKS
jgi:hypothetical protein